MPTTEPSLEEQIIQEIRETPEEHLPELLRIVQDFRDSVAPLSARESFRRGWHEAMTGQTRPIEELWDGIDVERGEAQ